MTRANLGDIDLHLAGEGRHERLYERLGAHCGDDGTTFAVWAPNARGVSVVGGRGNPLGIAAGVLTLCILRSGLSAIGVEPHVHDLVTGFILIAIAFLDAPELFRRITSWRLARAERNASRGKPP